MHTMEKAGRNRGAMTALGAVIAALLLPPPPFGGAASAVAVTGPESSSSSCTRSCDNISIPYPFGIEPGCYHGPGFNLTCRNGGSRGHGPPELFLGDGTVQVLEIPVEHSTVRIISTGVQLPRDGSGRSTTTMRWGLGLPKSGPYFLPESANMLKAVGCNIQVSVLGGIGNKSLLSSCTAICPSTSPDSFTKGNHGICTGNGCCQASIVLDYPWPFYTIQMKWLADHDVLLGPPGAVAYIADRSFDFSMDMIRGEGRPKALLATLDWTISNSTCPGNTAPNVAVPTAIAKTPLPGSMVGMCVDALKVMKEILMFLMGAKISLNANFQTSMLATVIARIHQEVLFATATLAIQAMLPSQMDAQV